MQKGLRNLLCTQRVRDYLARADLPAAIILVDAISALNIDHELSDRVPHDEIDEVVAYLHRQGRSGSN